MIAMVKMDSKGRVHIPSKVRKALKLASGQSVLIELKDNVILLKKRVKPSIENDKVLQDILLHPAHSKFKVTREMLEKMEEELWSS